MVKYTNTYRYFLDALKYITFEQFGDNKAALARAVGYSTGYITNILNGAKPAGYEAQTEVSEKLGYELFEFLQFGQALGNGESIEFFNNSLKDNIIYIPKVEARLAAGHGSYETNNNEVGLYSFRADWIHQMGNPDNMVLMDVVGDSMSPVILDGDTILLDHSKTDLLPNKIFAVRVEDLIYLKYIDREPRKFVLRSHNSDYPPIYIDTEYLYDTSFQILGRAIWWCHAETIK